MHRHEPGSDDTAWPRLTEVAHRHAHRVSREPTLTGKLWHLAISGCAYLLSFTAVQVALTVLALVVAIVAVAVIAVLAARG